MSKALNGLRVSADNLARVQAAVEMLGYVPNVAARSMRGTPTRTIGIVRNMAFHPGAELFSMWNTMIQAMEEHGYSVLISVARQADSAVDTLLRPFFERRVDGLFYWNAQPAPSLDRCLQARIPVLALAYRAAGCGSLPLVTADPRKAYVELFRSLRRYGHTAAIEITSGPAFASHADIARVERVRLEQVDVDIDRAAVREFVQSLMTDPGRPRAILARYPTALQVLDVCEELGVRIPEDLSLVSITGSMSAGLLRTPLSTVQTDFNRLGEVAAEAMISLIAGDSVGDIAIADSVHWVPRDSHGIRADAKVPRPHRRTRP
ncbi:LacI family DNA-binding transcriptional regulator [Dactylosporangium sp. CA-092794]|uniref:LacI family DNA-binding transcriptional regulator n=1 Tax=Dactylosporangium sp. CA-092794 TaxID=3239929 RepID=UPI003D945D76